MGNIPMTVGLGMAAAAGGPATVTVAVPVLLVATPILLVAVPVIIWAAVDVFSKIRDKPRVISPEVMEACRQQNAKEIKRRGEEIRRLEEELARVENEYTSADYITILRLKKDSFINSLSNEIKDRYPGSNEEKLRAEARDKFGIDSIHNYNFALTGDSGVGKSTLINAICGYDDSDPRAAEIDIVECTQEMKGHPHPHPKLKHLVLYDLPGAGTRRHPIETYFCDNRLYVFDCLVLVMERRIRQNDLAIAKFAQEMGTPVVFVRNKIEEDFKTTKRKNADKKEEELIQLTKSKVRKYICEELEEVGIKNPKVFLIEAHSLQKATTTKSEDLSQFEKLKFEELDLIKYATELVSAHND